MEAKRIKELWRMSDAELNKDLRGLQEAVFKFRFKKVVEEVTNVADVRKQKRMIAQIKTILQLRKLNKAPTQA